MQIGVTFSWGISLGSPALVLFFSFKEKKNIEQTTFQTGNIAACLGRQGILDSTEAEVVVAAVSELRFRTPTENGALKPSELGGRGRPLDEGEGWDNG